MDTSSAGDTSRVRVSARQEVVLCGPKVLLLRGRDGPGLFDTPTPAQVAWSGFSSLRLYAFNILGNISDNNPRELG